MSYRYTVNQIIKDVDRKLHTGGTSQTRDFFGALDEGRRSMIGKIRPTELERLASIEEALYDQVDKYAVPSDLNYSSVIDIKALSDRRNVDTLDHPLEQVYSRRFDQKRNHAKNIFSVNYENGVKYMRIYRPRGLRKDQHQLINDANSLTANGTWNTGGNLVNLRQDNLKYISGNGSLKFDFNSSGTVGTLQNFTLTPVDVHEFLSTGSVFTWFDTLDWRIVTSIKLTMGSDTSDLTTDLYEFTVNQPYDNNQFVNGWNLLRFPLDNMVMIGTPNPRSISYIKLEFTTTGDLLVGCHIDNIIARKGMVYMVRYESAYCFVDAQTLAWKQFATTNTDFIVLEEDGYQILMLETAMSILQESYGNSNRGNDDIVKLQKQLDDAYSDYRKNHKSEIIEPYQTSYILGDMYSGYTDDSLYDNDMFGHNNPDSNNNG